LFFLDLSCLALGLAHGFLLELVVGLARFSLAVKWFRQSGPMP